MGKDEINKIIEDKFEKGNCGVVIPIQQDGPTCGCYAAKMAINAIIGIDNIITADQIIEIAKNNGYSALGEMFSASLLVKTINVIFAQNKINNNPGISKYDVIAMEQSIGGIDECRYYLEAAKNRGVMILMPYYAGNINDYKPTELSKIQPDPNNMSNAHWAVVQYVNNDSAKIYESGSCTEINCALESLYKSNSSLGNEFSWDGYLKIHPEKEKEVEEWGKKYNKDIRKVKAELNGKIILIGIKKKVINHSCNII